MSNKTDKEMHDAHDDHDSIVADALNKLTHGLGHELGQMKGEFRGLKSYIKDRTDNCSNNYDSLTQQMGKLAGKINGVVIEKEVEDRVEGRFKKILYNRMTLLLTVIGLAIAFAGLQTSNTKKSDKKLQKISKEIRQMKTTNAGIVKDRHK